MLKSRKSQYITLMTLAVVGLAVDRFILSDSTPTPAVAEASQSTDGSETSAVSKTPTIVEKTAIIGESAGTPLLPEVVFPRAAGSWIPEVGKVRDIFSPPGSDETQDPGDTTAPRKSTSKISSARANFTQQFHLNGILVRDDLKIAVVDGQWLQIGDSIGGCRLTDVTGTEAHFRCQDGPITLTTVNVNERSPD